MYRPELKLPTAESHWTNIPPPWGSKEARKGREGASLFEGLCHVPAKLWTRGAGSDVHPWEGYRGSTAHLWEGYNGSTAVTFDVSQPVLRHDDPHSTHRQYLLFRPGEAAFGDGISLRRNIIHAEDQAPVAGSLQVVFTAARPQHRLQQGQITRALESGHLLARQTGVIDAGPVIWTQEEGQVRLAVLVFSLLVGLERLRSDTDYTLERVKLGRPAFIYLPVITLEGDRRPVRPPLMNLDDRKWRDLARKTERLVNTLRNLQMSSKGNIVKMPPCWWYQSVHLEDDGVPCVQIHWAHKLCAYFPRTDVDRTFDSTHSINFCAGVRTAGFTQFLSSTGLLIKNIAAPQLREAEILIAPLSFGVKFGHQGRDRPQPSMMLTEAVLAGVRQASMVDIVNIIWDVLEYQEKPNPQHNPQIDFRVAMPARLCNAARFLGPDYDWHQAQHESQGDRSTQDDRRSHWRDALYEKQKSQRP